MRRAVLLFTVIGAMLLLVSGIALAATFACTAGAQYCDGTNEADMITGTEGRDYIRAGSGNDQVYAQGDNDYLRGSFGSDVLIGDAGNELGGPNPRDGDDRIFGSSGRDHLIGFGRSDYLSGGSGDDTINAEENNPPKGTDTVFGGRDDDVIFAVDGVIDRINCGDDFDEVEYDTGIDVVNANCEDRFPRVAIRELIPGI